MYRLEPLLYQVVVIHSRDILDDEDVPPQAVPPQAARVPVSPVFEGPWHAFFKLMELKPASFFHEHVRHIYFYNNMWASEGINKILSVCDAVVSVAFYFISDGPGVLPLIELLPVRYLVCPSALFNTMVPDFHHPIFAHITHLDVQHWRGESWPAWSGLAAIPHLTHLSLHDGSHQPFVDSADSACRGALAHCAGLKVLVIIWWSTSILKMRAPEHAPLATDPRFVMLVVENELTDWVAGARGGEDYWARAEAHIEKRRLGETKGQPIALGKNLH